MVDRQRGGFGGILDPLIYQELAGKEQGGAVRAGGARTRASRLSAASKVAAVRSGASAARWRRWDDL